MNIKGENKEKTQANFACIVNGVRHTLLCSDIMASWLRVLQSDSGTGKCSITSGHNSAVLEQVEMKDTSLESSMYTLLG